MSCKSCNEGNGSCAVLLVGKEGEQSAAAMSGVKLEYADMLNLSGAKVSMSPGIQATPNCLFGPLDETTCTRQVRQLANRARGYTVKSTFAQLGTTAFSPNFGFSPYTALVAGEEYTFTVNVPTERLSACMQIAELKVTVVGPGFSYDGPVSMANSRNAWWAELNDVVNAVSASNGGYFGQQLLTTASLCACKSLPAWAPYDKPAQVEFTIPGYTVAVSNVADVITLRYQVERTYVVLLKADGTCEFPERCSEPLWTDVRNTPL